MIYFIIKLTFCIIEMLLSRSFALQLSCQNVIEVMKVNFTFYFECYVGQVQPVQRHHVIDSPHVPFTNRDHVLKSTNCISPSGSNIQKGAALKNTDTFS